MCSCSQHITNTTLIALLELSKYSHLEAEYGVIPFKIATDKYYPSDWQRINGDPHGQAAEKEAPDALGDETLSFDFPKDKNGGYYELYLWTHSASGKLLIICKNIQFILLFERSVFYCDRVFFLGLEMTGIVSE